MDEILQLNERIVQEFQPERVILFGSYAYGTPDSDSDVDLLVVLPFEGQGCRKSLEIIAAVEPSFAVDLLVRTPQQLQQRLEWNDFFIREIVEKGKVLYEAPDS
jgi:uncharacterized protein